ncbi:LysR family transcriptional regulator [Sphingorhabdus arenilitoris]|uniref:LysR family transcriptional regulator n=1 Tax=Sphingorhabdus arenilitoris TaxID=1490041 RepID=A0ABV8RGT1_9SPHN
MQEPSWDAIRCFTVIADKGSFTDASGSLGLSVATLGRRIDSLEAAVGFKLLRRGPSGTSLTDQGRSILNLAKSGALHLDQISRAARAINLGLTQTPVRISSTESMIADVLAPNLPKLYQAVPGISVELETSNEPANLNAGNTDIAVRLARPRADTLITRQLQTIELGLYTSHAYLNGRDPAALQLGNEYLLWYDSAFGEIPENIWLKDAGLEQMVRLRAGSVRALTHAATNGLGIAPLPAFLANAAKLVRIPSAPLPDRKPFLVFHRDTRNNKIMKRVRQWIIECCEATFQ